ncbi:DUF6093 family protein [Sphaerimonospora thailandensis]|uniref:Head-to-tail stopper n=1 Tax=Sphaerimonospora thailandensis TaxID=795644 RepID=A0A8J3VZQ2_9ACTN|nr:DUF6093 family protein [Sphaerimonospora thailandensis]GIH70340.1 hypothetical protein Mth01_25930 [Sphaerimonospora thailandensis]
MSVEGLVAAGRRAALALMRDTCVIERASGERVFDPSTGQYTQAWETVYTGPCRVKQTGGTAETPYGDAQSITLHRYEVRLPWTAAPQVQREDRMTVTTSDDTWLVGRPLEVVDVGFASTGMARRLVVEDKA